MRALVLPSENIDWLEERNVKVYRGSICEPDTLTAPMHGVDTVFHLAAMQGLWVPMEEYYKVNVSGTENRHSIDRARTELGYVPQVSIREGVHLACEWYKQQNLSSASDMTTSTRETATSSIG